MDKPISSYRVLTFDCYGTLIDWEQGIWDAFQPLLLHNKHSNMSRATVLQQFAAIESYQQRKEPKMKYSKTLSVVHELLAKRNLMKTTKEMNDRFSESILYWPPFSDVIDALRNLQTKYRLVILSNVDRISFEASNKKLDLKFDAIYTAEEIGSYKPDLRNFRYMLHRLGEEFGYDVSDILHVAQSLYHDHLPAKKLGLATVWIDRQYLLEGIRDLKRDNWGATTRVNYLPEIDFVFNTLEEFARLALA